MCGTRSPVSAMPPGPPDVPTAPRLRWDALTGRWCLLAPNRRATPRDMTSRVDPLRDASACPFCPGHEREADPPTEERLGADGRWLARAITNRFPMMARQGTGEVTRRGAFREREATGEHEVIVETTAHDADLSDLDAGSLAVVLDLHRSRHRALAARPDAAAVLLFKNRGPRSGASLRHPHSQILTTPVVPSAVRRRDAVAERHHRREGSSLVGWLLDAELTDRARIVEEGEHFVALCPWASARSQETWVVPRAPIAHFGATPDALLLPFAAMLRATLRRVRRASGDADYNILLRQPARARWGEPWAHWFMEIQVRRGGDAGFELSSGTPCAVFSPEESAAALRAVDVL
jgi:UDPglucose--hexose-1-phosphate uridylyltransferase